MFNQLKNVPTNQLHLPIINIKQNLKKTGIEALKNKQKRIFNGSMYNIFSNINAK